MQQQVTTISENGKLTLPPAILEHIGLSQEQSFWVDTNQRGEIILKQIPANDVQKASDMIESYSEERIVEFNTAQDSITDWITNKLTTRPST